MLPQGYKVTLLHQGSHWWYRARRDLFLRQVRRAARELGSPERKLSLLDYGCASGFDLPLLSEVGTAEGADIVNLTLVGDFANLATSDRLADVTDAADPAPANAITAAAAPPRRHLSGSPSEIIHIVPRDLPALRGRFHIVTCLDVLEHLDDDIDGLRTIASLLVPDGQLIVTVPAYPWLWSGEDVISQHRRRYTRGSLLAACRAAGFDALFASYFNISVLPAMALVVRWRRLFHNSWRSESNLTAGPGWLDGPVGAVTGIEARAIGDERFTLPAGTSLVCRMRRGSAQ
jgi:2-polyprenyl-3-methyl-5-hydroxy-6-metoxy-1,4-benzoquinol methylase